MPFGGSGEWSTSLLCGNALYLEGRVSYIIHGTQQPMYSVSMVSLSHTVMPRDSLLHYWSMPRICFTGLIYDSLNVEMIMFRTEAKGATLSRASEVEEGVVAILLITVHDLLVSLREAVMAAE